MYQQTGMQACPYTVMPAKKKQPKLLSMTRREKGKRQYYV